MKYSNLLLKKKKKKKRRRRRRRYIKMVVNPKNKRGDRSIYS
jgi:hypothetical protein